MRTQSFSFIAVLEIDIIRSIIFDFDSSSFIHIQVWGRTNPRLRLINLLFVRLCKWGYRTVKKLLFEINRARAGRL